MGEKRSSADVEENSKLGRKRLKMRDLDSVIRSEGIDTHYPKSIKMIGTFFSVEKEGSKKVSKDSTTTNSDIARAEIAGGNTLPSLFDPSPKFLDLNTKVGVASNPAGGDTAACANKLSPFVKDGTEHDPNFAMSRPFGWDLNTYDAPNSIGQDPFYPCKNREFLKSGDSSECGSTTGPLEEKDSMSVWKEMKQNGFLSSSHGGIPMPKSRRRRSKSDGLKKKMEIAKREQVDRFAKIAAPSGLLNELNPGIINHVRNSRQVHSIIEALVRSENHEKRHAGGKQAMPTKNGAKEILDRKKDMENGNGSGMNQLGLSNEDESLSTLSVSQPRSLSESVRLNSDHSGKEGELNNVERRIFAKTTCSSHNVQASRDDLLALKLSSSTTLASENASSLSNEESVSLTGVSSLSVKAARVASHWLDLLHHDIKGRLAALRRSKKRVRAVIHTELPFLMSREFSRDQENDPYVTNYSAAGCSDHVNATVHQARWSALFDQMDKALSEEEKQLEIWLNQVKEMQLHCEKGLQHFHFGSSHGSQGLGTFENDTRLGEADSSERELAVTATAASIYSTCNFLLSTCF